MKNLIYAQFTNIIHIHILTKIWLEKYNAIKLCKPSRKISLLVNKKGIEVNSLKKLPEGIITYSMVYLNVFKNENKLILQETLSCLYMEKWIYIHVH